MDAELELVKEFFCRYGSLYAPQLVLLMALSAMTVYRREMSCNHCYAEETKEGEGDGDNTRSTDESSNELQRRPPRCDSVETERLLESMGLYASGAALLPLLEAFALNAERARQGLVLAEDILLQHAEKLRSGLPLKNEHVSGGCGRRTAPSDPTTICHCSKDKQHQRRQQRDAVAAEASSEDPHFWSKSFPSDAQVHILSFLHPKDVVTLSSVCRSCRHIVERGETSAALWKTLWCRDYAWIVTSWDVGRQALERSGVNLDDFVFSKDFYFRFGMSYINYVCAGRATMEQCLVGLGGHIYDLSSFAVSHPGSPETVLVQAGKDATRFFSSVRHTLRARRLAQSMCVVVDTSRLEEASGYNCCGVRPTKQTETLNNGRIPKVAHPPPLFMETSVSGASNTLQRLHHGFAEEEERARVRAKRLNSVSALGESNVYYDPFCDQWKAWYMDSDLDTVFTHI